MLANNSSDALLSVDLPVESRAILAAEFDIHATNMPIVVLLTDHIVDANVAACAALGCDQRGELVGRSWADFLVESQIDEAYARSEAIITSQRATDLKEYEIQLVTGETTQCVIHSIPIEFNGERAILCFIADAKTYLPSIRAANDHSRFELRSESLAELLRENERLRNHIERLTRIERFLVDERSLNEKLFHLTQEAVAVTKNGKITVCNPMFARFANLERIEDGIGTELEQWLEPSVYRQLFPLTENVKEDATPLKHLFGSVEDRPRIVESVPAGFEKGGNRYELLVSRDVSDRVEAERKLAESEERFHTLFDLAPAGIMVIDTAIIFANRKMCEILGIADASEIVGKLPIDFTHEDYQADVRYRMEAGETIDWTIPVQRVYVRPDGTTRKAQVTAAQIPDGDAKLLVIAVHDVTEAAQAMARLAESEDRLKTFLWAGDVGAWEWNMADDSIYLSPEIRRELGISDDPSTWYSSMVACIHPDDVDHVFELSRRYIDGGIDQLSTEIRLRVSSDEYRWYLMRGRKVDLSGQANSKFAGTLTDVHLRHEQEERLREAEERFELALRGGDQSVWDWEIESGTAAFSSEWRSMLGLESADELHQDVESWNALVHPDDFAANWEKQSMHMRGETPNYEAEFRMRHSDGHWIWVLSRGKVTKRGPNGEPLRIVGTHTNISSRKLDEQRIEELNVELMERARLLESSNAELETFAYSVSHDLRAPLRSIDGFAAALQEDYDSNLDGEGRLYVERIRSSAKRMSDLIDDLLALSRVTRQPIKCRIVDLSAMVGAIGEELIRFNPDREIVFEIEPEVEAFADHKLIQIVLENLLENAVKFSLDRRPACIQFFREIREGKAVFCVRDNGIGFDKKYSHSLFRPFARLHHDSRFEGHGIGLATVQRIVTRHGGSVWAVAKPQQGAEFSFTLG